MNQFPAYIFESTQPFAYSDLGVESDRDVQNGRTTHRFVTSDPRLADQLRARGLKANGDGIMDVDRALAAAFEHRRGGAKMAFIHKAFKHFGGSFIKGKPPKLAAEIAFIKERMGQNMESHAWFEETLNAGV